MASIDYDYIFSNLDTVLGLPLRRRGKRWTLPARINLESHSRKDKLVFYMNKSGSITVTEQGGDSVNLFDFLVSYLPGCSSASDAFRILSSPEGCRMSLKDFYEREYDSGRQESKFVDVKYVDRLSDAGHWKGNNLYEYLSGVFGVDSVNDVFSRYKVGCLGRESAVFWYSDKDGNVCHDNRIRYGVNGHRKKETHAFRKFTTGEGFTYRGYFKPFLGDYCSDAITCMVESEKTAIIASMAFGNGFVWIACGGMNQLGNKLPKNVILFPDFDNKAISLWGDKGRVARWWEHPILSFGLKHNDDIGDAVINNLNSINIKEFRKWILE